MLGLMNSPSECVDFYAQPKGDHDSSAFLGKNRKKSTIAYMSDGRRMIDGKVEIMKEPQEMWSSLLIKSAARHVDGNNGGILERCVRDAARRASTGSITKIEPTLLHIVMRSKPKVMTVVDYLGSTNVVLSEETVEDEAEDEEAIEEEEAKEYPDAKTEDGEEVEVDPDAKEDGDEQ